MPDRRLSRRSFLALAGAIPLAACATVPDADDYLRPDGAVGPHQNVGSDDILQRQFALQQALSESPLTAGNQVRLLRDGQEAFAAMFDAMRQARDHINLEYFIFEDVQVGQIHLSDLLIGRLAGGLAVNIIYDAYGSRATPVALFDEFRKAGARVVEFNPMNPLAALDGHSPNDRDHRKIMVVDGRIGFVGGTNLARVYENPPDAGFPADGDDAHAYWRDTAAEMRGPVVAEMQRLFFDTWAKQKGDPVQPASYFPPLARQGVQTVRIIGSAPGEERPLYYLSLETAIRAAVHQAWLSSGYFVPPHQEREDLAKAARRSIFGWWCPAMPTSTTRSMPAALPTATCSRRAGASSRCGMRCCIRRSPWSTVCGRRSVHPTSIAAAWCSTTRSMRSCLEPRPRHRSRRC